MRDFKHSTIVLLHNLSFDFRDRLTRTPPSLVAVCTADDEMFLESLDGFASTYIGGQEDFSFFSFLFLLVNYTYIFRLTMRDLFNGRESGNGIRTRRSWEPFRSALASSSFTARSQM